MTIPTIYKMTIHRIISIVIIFVSATLLTPTAQALKKHTDENKKWEDGMADNKYDRVVRDLIIKELKLEGSNRQVLQISDLTASAPYQIPGVYLYRSFHEIDKDPVPVNYWVFLPPDKLGGGMLRALMEIKFVPTSEGEALKTAALIEYAKGEHNYIYRHQAKDGHDFNEETRRQLADPVVVKKDAYYEVTFYAVEYYAGGIPRINGYTLKLGTSVYEQKTIKQILP